MQVLHRPPTKPIKVDYHLADRDPGSNPGRLSKRWVVAQLARARNLDFTTLFCFLLLPSSASPTGGVLGASPSKGAEEPNIKGYLINASLVPANPALSN